MRFLLSILFSFVSFASFAQLLEVKETFSYNSPTLTAANSSALELIGWRGAQTSSGTFTKQVHSSFEGYSTAPPIGTGYYTDAIINGFVASSGSADRYFYHTTKTVLITRTGKELSRVVMATAHNSTNTESYFAVQVGGNWFAYKSGSDVQSTDAGSDATVAFQSATVFDHTLNMAASNWYPITFTLNTALSLGATGQTLPSGDVTGYGIYFYKPSSTSTVLRFDDITIYTAATSLSIPAKPTGVAITSGNFNWTNVSGFSADADYEYTTNAGRTYTTSGSRPITLSASYYAAYQVGVRVKLTGANTYSETAWNTSPYSTYSGLRLKETFPYSGTTNMTELGWRMAYSSSGTIGSPGINRNDPGSPELSQYSASTNFLNTNGLLAEGTTTDTKFYHTTYSMAISRTGFELSQIRYKTANNSATSAGWLSRAVVKIGSTWYVYESAANANEQTTSSGSGTATAFSNYTLQVDENISGANWYELTFVDNTSMSVSTTGVNLPSGDIVGVGVYYHRSASSSTATRLDDFEIYTTPTGLPRRVTYIQ